MPMQYQVDKLQVQYFVQSARLLVRLPQDGEKWFYITPHCRVGKLIDDITQEDETVNSVQILDSKGTSVDNDENIFKLLKNKDKTVL